MRIIALLATYNEGRFIRQCIEQLLKQGVEVYVIDNESTDVTPAVAREYFRQGVVGIETLKRRDMYSWRPILQRKEQLADTLEADWFMHVDADEVRLPSHPGQSLSEALDEVDRQGYNAVNFQEFTFVPTAEDPDHDHPAYLRTMRWYYPFLPAFPHRLNAWKKPAPGVRVELAWSGGHQVRFPGLRMFPQSFVMKHYLFLSPAHAIEKYVRKTYDPAEVASGWHGGRARLTPQDIVLLSASQLRHYLDDDRLDASNPETSHFLFRSLEKK
ncbi:MAG: glycosyltransferase family A protein [Candidatus Competibacteraceae bacterium]